ncbi:hypothetical protein P175DRAFT_075279 [Aspergillus ochraceoroseus IBT 24754]|uniref:Alpha-1,2-mannosyltransferase (Kre2) n=3 Tax=Aspergillus subgen. Nidulantes TaxID=2720870 RepID=A0A0F8V5X6_9EURO|nr:uncharacterized protein P175DRAFT_075279 [Aspergillus ochraceoroseus IBT 24754]KKK20177.1 hypothetical protein AOCH_004052 [Aspergillus ochraceoroseus]KKK27138.1 hypothetical protein ARAM_001289 [Aspergillus rambellii]PTU25313.1 hypothetical protein P175DRAFT_075279 [Aspergillus ochraceoroseus IBT 24754]
MSPGQEKYIRYLLFAVAGVALFFYFTRGSLPIPDNFATKTGYAAAKSPANLSPHSLQDPTSPEDSLEEPEVTYASDVLKFAATHPGGRTNATFVTLAKNSDLWEIAKSIRQVEGRFNHKFHYDWVFLNDQPFDDDFKRITTSLVSGTTYYGEIPEEHWSYPDWIDQDKASRVREEMQNKRIIYGNSESYRHMCRYESGFFFRHPLLKDYEFYWRVEPSIELFCDIPYDPFLYMKENDKKYSFVMSMYEYYDTIPTLWPTVKKFAADYPEYIAEGNSIDFLSDDGGKTFNKCHFWSNFEIGSLDWLRSKEYLEYFEALDRGGGFFYERWGDAPIHSIAAGLMLKKEQIHFWNEISYYHIPFTHCPLDDRLRTELQCTCDPKLTFDWRATSCLSRYYEINHIPKPPGVDHYSPLAVLGGVILSAALVGILVIAVSPRSRGFVLHKTRRFLLEAQALWEEYRRDRLAKS